MTEPESIEELVSLFATTLNSANETRRSLSEADRKRRETKSAKGELRQAAELLRKCRAAICEPAEPTKQREQLLAMVKHWLRAMLDLTFVNEEHMAEHDFQSAKQTQVALQQLEEGVTWIGRLTALGSDSIGSSTVAAESAVNERGKLPSTPPVPPRTDSLLHSIATSAIGATGAAEQRAIPALSRDAGVTAPHDARGTESEAAAVGLVGSELWEVLCWRRGALCYMAASCAIKRLADPTAADTAAAAPTAESGAEESSKSVGNYSWTESAIMDLLEHGCEALSQMGRARIVGRSADESPELVAAGKGGSEVEALLNLGIYSDMHLLAAMYEAEMSYWRWAQILKSEPIDPSSNSTAETWRLRSLWHSARYVHAIQDVMDGRGWDTARAMELSKLLSDSSTARGARPSPLCAVDGMAATASSEDRFTLDTVTVRMPRIVEVVLERIGDALDGDARRMLLELIDEMRDTEKRPVTLAGAAAGDANVMTRVGRPLRLLKAGAGSIKDVMAWNGHLLPHVARGKTWLDSPWWLCENYMYKRILEATSGQGVVDPFASQKMEALEKAVVALERDVLPLVSESVASADAGILSRFVLRSLWGNRADLSLSAGAVVEHDSACNADALLADDRLALCAVLCGSETLSPAASVLLVLDNCGLEFVCDLAFVDALLRLCSHRTVTLLAKDAPVFISDVCEHDIETTLEWMAARGPSAAELAERLRGFCTEGRLIVRSHPFFTSPLPWWQMPDDVRAIVDDHAITIMKGDANYRRLLGDLHWPFDHPFVDVAAPFPGDVCALRTLKSGVCCGVSAAEQERARATDASWCTSGKFGVIQFKHDQ